MLVRCGMALWVGFYIPIGVGLIQVYGFVGGILYPDFFVFGFMLCFWGWCIRGFSNVGAVRNVIVGGILHPELGRFNLGFWVL